MSSALDRLTPQLIGLDSRALPVRSVAYHRHPDQPDTQTRIGANRYDGLGRLIASWDARLSALRETNSVAHANQQTLFSLSATALTTYRCKKVADLVLPLGRRQRAFLHRH